MRIAVVGAGGVGGYVGGRLAAAGEDVTLVARGRISPRSVNRVCACEVCSGTSRFESPRRTILSTIAEPGVIAHTGGPARILFGEPRRSLERVRAEAFAAACRRAGMAQAASSERSAACRSNILRPTVQTIAA